MFPIFGSITHSLRNELGIAASMTVSFASEATKKAASKTLSLTGQATGVVVSAAGVAASKTASYVYEKAKERYPTAVEKVEKFSDSVIGRQVSSAISSAAAETVGMTAGSLFPGQMIAFSAGRRVADYLVPDSQEEGATGRKSWLVWSAGVGAVLTVFALSTTITYLTADPTSGTAAYSFLITSLGTIVGGIEGLRVIGAEPIMSEGITDSYPIRTFQYLAAQGAVEVVRGVVPVPRSLVPLTGLVGGTIKAVAGTAGYYAKPLTQMSIRHYYRQPITINYYDPGEILKAVVENTYQTTQHFNQEMAQYANFILFAARFVEGMLGRVIDQKVGANVLVRTFNEYVRLIQHPEIQEATRELTSCADPEQRKVLQQRLSDRVYQEIANQFGISERVIAYAFQIKTNPMVHGYVKWLVDQIQEKEIQMIGFELSDPQKSKAMLEIHAVSYLTLTLIQLTRALPRGVESKDLTDRELKDFYQNLNTLIFSPYVESAVGRAAQGVVGFAIPRFLDHAQFLPAIALGRTGGARIEEITEGALITENNESATTTPEKSASFFERFLVLQNVKNFFVNVKNFITSSWDSITSAFTRKKQPVTQIELSLPEISYTHEILTAEEETPILKEEKYTSLPFQMKTYRLEDIISGRTAPSA